MALKNNLAKYVGELRQASSTSVSKSVAAARAAKENFSKNISAVNDQVSKLYSEGLDGLLENLVEQSEGNISQLLLNITDGSMPESAVIETQKYLQDNNLAAAASTVAQYTDSYDEQQLQDILSGLRVHIDEVVVIEAQQNVFPPADVIGSDTYKWSGSNTQGNVFTFISSAEELQAEFRSITRDVYEIVVHWTDTYTNQNLTAQQVHDMHNAMQMDGIQYHYLIRRDGTVQRGMPVNRAAEHTAAADHNQFSISVAFVGGINAPSGTEDAASYRSANSLTQVQMQTFYQMCKSYYNVFPGGQILGHNAIDPNEMDPGFDVIDYCLTSFNKRSAFSDPYAESVRKPQDINLPGPHLDVIPLSELTPPPPAILNPGSSSIGTETVPGIDYRAESPQAKLTAAGWIYNPTDGTWDNPELGVFGRRA